MDAITPEEARAYFRRWQLLREEEARQLARTPMETKLRQLAALMASRHLFGVEPDREAIMGLKLALELIELLRQCLVGREHFAHAHERPHDLDVDGDRTIAVKHGRKHGHTLLREGAGQVLAVLSTAPL